MADRTMSATTFIDLCAGMGYPQADVVKGLVEDYGYDTDTATLAVEGAYDQQADLDLENATNDQPKQ